MIWPIKLSPAECHLVARDRGKPMTAADIARKSGLPIGVVRWIMQQTEWNKLYINIATLYAAACGVTHKTQRRQIAYLKRALRGGRRAFPHLRRLTTRQQKSIRSALSRGDSGASQATLAELKAWRRL